MQKLVITFIVIGGVTLLILGGLWFYPVKIETVPAPEGGAWPGMEGMDFGLGPGVTSIVIQQIHVTLASNGDLSVDHPDFATTDREYKSPASIAYDEEAPYVEFRKLLDAYKAMDTTDASITVAIMLEDPAAEETYLPKLAEQIKGYHAYFVRSPK